MICTEYTPFAVLCCIQYLYVNYTAYSNTIQPVQTLQNIPLLYMFVTMVVYIQHTEGLTHSLAQASRSKECTFATNGPHFPFPGAYPQKKCLVGSYGPTPDLYNVVEGVGWIKNVGLIIHPSCGVLFQLLIQIDSDIYIHI